MEAPVFLGADEVAARLDTRSLMAALEGAFLDPPAAPPRSVIPIDDKAGSSLLVMPAVRAGGLIVVKLVTVHPRLARRPAGPVRASVMALDAVTGEALGWVDGHSLTLRRTAAASTLAASRLARADARRLLVVGAGAVARSLAGTYLEVFALDTIEVWARRPEAAASLAAELAGHGAPARAVQDLDAAVKRADIVTAATLSEHPLVRGAHVRPGTHVDLVGGFRPAMREADDTLMARAQVTVDTEAALAEAGDLVQPLAAGVLDRSRIRTLAHLLRDPSIRDPDAVTVFKSVGCALEDLAAVELLFARRGGAP